MSLSCRPGHYGDVRVLVVEDQKVLADRIAEGLRDQGMAVDIAYDGGAAMEIAAFTAYDVIVLDRDLPRVHGDAVLVARIRSLARRSPSRPPVAFCGDLAVDLARRRVSRAGRPVTLTRKEFGVLEVLLAADGGVVSAEELLEKVWDEHADPFSNTVSVTVSRLRRKLGSPPPIQTVVGSGYRLLGAS
jgi:DNA-binding response OmpR family regulator